MVFNRMTRWSGVNLFCVVFLALGAIGVSPTVRAQDEEAAAVSVATEVAEASSGEAAAAEEGNPKGWNEGDPVSSLSYDDANDYAINTLIMFICAVLVIFMQAGFAIVEIGLNSAKNAVNILSKNVMDFCVGVLLFLFVGYSLMYPGDSWMSEEYLGNIAPFVTRDAQVTEVNGEEVWAAPPAYSDGAYAANSADFLFQVAFAATAATIVSGAVAGRLKFSGYLIYTAILTCLVYPIS